MAFVGGRRDRDIAPGSQRQGALGDDVAGNDPQVLPGRHLHLPARSSAGTILGNGLVPVPAPHRVAVHLLGGGDVYITHRLQAHVIAALEHAPLVGDIPSCTHRQVMTRLNPRRTVGKTTLFGLVASAAGMPGNGSLIGQITGHGDNTDIPPSNNPASPVSKILTRQRIQPTTRFHQPTVDQAVARRRPQVAGRTQGARIVQVLTRNQADV